MRRLIIRGLMALIIAGLVGCGIASLPDTEETKPVSGGVTEAVEVEIDPAVSSGINASDIKEIPVEVEGETEMRKAQFNRSGLGYSIYVLEDYQLVNEEAQRDVLHSKFDDSYVTRVIVHGIDADAPKMKANILEHAEGEIEEVNVPLSEVEFALHELVEFNGEKTSITYVAKKYNGQLIEFTIFLPIKEPIEGIEPSMWAMLETIEFKP